ncbi:MAG: hypothetical protein ACYCWW_20425 [Deltaproteobacteria bacterium]
MKTLVKMNRKNRGQGMTEYIIIVALIAIAAVAIVTAFGGNIRALFGNSTDVLAGATKGTNGTLNKGTVSMSKDLKDFSDTTTK